MKNGIISMSTVTFLMLTAIAVEAQNNPPYVVPVGTDGKPDDAARVQMSEVGDHYEITKVEIAEGGFLFAGIGSTEGSYYSLTGCAVNPPVYALPNPLSISGGQQTPIKVEPGTYDISFYTRDSSQSGYHQMLIVPSDTPEGPYYPGTLYLLSSTGVLNTISGTNGEYILSENLPTVPFRISYEPQIGTNTYIFGPTSATDSTLAPDTDCLSSMAKEMPPTSPCSCLRMSPQSAMN